MYEFYDIVEVESGALQLEGCKFNPKFKIDHIV